MIENELREKLTDIEMNLWRYENKYNRAKDDIKRKKAEDKLTYYSGKEAGLLEAIKILWGEDYEDKLYKED